MNINFFSNLFYVVLNKLSKNYHINPNCKALENINTNKNYLKRNQINNTQKLKSQ